MNKLDRLAYRFRLKPLRLMLLPWLIWLPGCATQDYSIYSASQVRVEIAKYEADATQAKAKSASEIARYDAIAKIAAQGDSTVKAVAVMQLQQGAAQSVATAAPSTQIAAPAPMGDTALRWASVLVPGLTQMVGLRYQYLSNTVQSNNSRAVAESQNATYLGIAGKIQAPAANYTTLSGTGSLGSGTYSNDRHDANLLGTGTLGSGPYTDSKPITTTDSHQVTDSHPVTTNTSTDNHTVTPAPVITPVVQVVPVVTSTTAATATASTATFTPWVTP